MKNSINYFGAIMIATTMLISCGGKTTEQCKDDVRAYEFGREMQTWVELRSAGLSLQDAINESSDGLGISPPYDANNECV
jgi:hypothetical protein